MVRSAILSLSIADILLIFLGLMLYPNVVGQGGLLGAGAASAMVTTYGWVALFSPLRPERLDPRMWKKGAMLGVASGLWLGLDLLSNYFIYRDGTINSKISLIVYGVYFLLLVGVAASETHASGQFKSGMVAALWYNLPAQLIWLFSEFACYYLFSRTPTGTRFIETEMHADFERHGGGGDFQTYVIGDFFGAGFFHLLLIGLVGVLLFASLGAVIGKVIAALRRRVV